MMRRETSDDSDEIREIRLAAARLCGQFPGSYWRKLDREAAYPTEFVTALACRGRIDKTVPLTGLPAVAIEQAVAAPACTVRLGVSLADVTTGMTAHAAMLEALLHHDDAHRETPRVGLSHASIYPYGAFACADGEVVAVVQTPHEWVRFCAMVLQRPDLTLDPRFANNPARVVNRVALDAIIGPIFATQTRAGMIAVLEAANLPWSRVSTVADLSAHPALRRMQGTVTGGSFCGAVSPLRRDLVAGPVPELGQHTNLIRAEFSK